MYARRKGKAQRRIKGWGRKYVDGADFERDAPVRRRMTQRAVKLPPARLEAPEQNLEDLPKTQGMVVGMFPGGAAVRVEGRELLCAIAKTFRAPEGATALAVGDAATVALTLPEHADGSLESDRERADGMILARAPRQTALSRPAPRSGKRRDQFDTETFEKVLVANMDILLIVAATREPPLRHGMIDRFLIIAERGELEPILVINKIDLGPPDPNVLTDFESLGVRIVQCSALTATNLDSLRKVLANKRSVLAGASGVGKSALINALVPGARAVTREVRGKDKRGRHTTSAATVYDLPGGGIIVDTPGLRELGVGLDTDQLPWYFPEFEALAGKCKFRDCTHTHEPDCAVISAVDAGTILPRRYNSYLCIRQTLEQH